MNQPIQEHLSALMDGELGRDETRFLLRRAESDRGLAVRWTRYHVARQALRREETFAMRADFANVVMARLEADAAPAISRNVWVRWGSGGAIAAAVAVAALMVTRPPSTSDTSPRVATATPRSVPSIAPATTQIAAANAGVQTAPLVPNSPIQTTAASFGPDLAEPVTFDPRLQSYLIRHAEPGAAASSDFAVPYLLLAQPAQRAPAQPDHR